MQLTTVIVAVFAVYVSYNGFSFVRQYWEHLRLGWDALQQLQELPQEHIDDFFEAYKRLSERTLSLNHFSTPMILSATY